MSIIGFIDDRINCSYAENVKNITFYKNIHGKFVEYEKNCSEDITHSTLCLSIFHHINKCDEILHIECMRDNDSASVTDLCLCLEFCHKLGVDLIHLSLGSTRLSDTRFLYPIIKKLTKHGIKIIAAVSNDGFITLPASFPEVTGVMADRFNLLKAYTAAKVKKNAFGINYVSNYDIKVNENENIPKSNSFAVPVIVSHFANRNLHIVKKNKYSVNAKELCVKKAKKIVPLISIDSKIINNKIFLIALLDALACRFEIESICMTNKKSKDIRFYNSYRKKIHMKL